MKNRTGRASIGSGGAVLATVLLVAGCSPHTEKTATTSATTSATTPAPTVSGPLTDQETRWIEAVDALSSKMNRVVKNGPTMLTAATMTALAKELRGCSRELTRIGVPSARLLPAHALVKQACARYDDGAKCFEDAAGMGVPFEGAESRKQGRKIDCGFGGANKGIVLLVDAQTRAEKIEAAAG